MNNPIITISDLHISFKNNEILKNINLTINEGDFIYLIGETGSGKSSLLKSLYKEIDFQKGSISIGEFNLNNMKKNKIAYLRRQLGIIFQDFQLLSDRNIYKNLEFVLRSTGWKDKNKIKERITEVLDTVHLEGVEKKMSHELSGGEQQRVSISRALLNHPKIILADEPTGNLDPEKSNSIIETMKEINSNGTTVIIATHDYSIIKNFPSKTYRFENKEIKEVMIS
ncbi:MAG: ATP-binding cassette domain-containing protein [Flavobacteriales bacterium]|jgi:cell division transport system ATP-binding protein|nr:ATP-binding cassette domain-containing protein [Flavobacteriales bacterium]MDG2058768.1 ATP-binding cassette domain-containing protein [Flavobacteriales bacterium]